MAFTRKTFEKKGFSLVELMIVIALLAILATLVVVKLNKESILKSKAVKIQQVANTLQKKVYLFFRDTGYLPSTISELWEDKDANGEVIPNWNGPYISPFYVKDNKLALGDYVFDTRCVEGSDGKLDLVIANIPPNLASYFDKEFDDGNLDSGKVKYSPNNEELTIHLYDAEDFETKYIYCR